MPPSIPQKKYTEKKLTQMPVQIQHIDNDALMSVHAAGENIKFIIRPILNL